MRLLSKLHKGAEGSALVEFAIALPLLVVFIVGIYDFSGAFNQKQKIEHAAEEGAVIAGAQPRSDMDPGNANPDSLEPVVSVIYNSLANGNVINRAACQLPARAVHVSNLTWRYTISGCPDTLTIEIDRGWVPSGAPAPQSVGTQVKVTYPYQWRFNSAIQLLFPGAAYAATTDLSETARVHNQM